MTSPRQPNRDSQHFAESMNKWPIGKRSLHCCGFREEGAHCLSRGLNSAAALGKSFCFLPRPTWCLPLAVSLVRRHHHLYRV